MNLKTLQTYFVCFIAALCAGCSSSGSSSSDSATCERSAVLAGSNCGCELQAPVDLAQLYPTNGIWPFGVHGGGHPEGHPGWDFQSGSISSGTQLVISAPADGHIFRIEADNSGEDAEGKNVYIKLNCGIQVLFTPMRPDTTVSVGMLLVKGQRLGVMSLINGTSWSVHMGIATKDSDPKKTFVCPTPFFPASIVSELESIVGAASFSERSARNVDFICDDSTTLNINLPAEPNLCADHLSTELASQIDACIRPEFIDVW